MLPHSASGVSESPQSSSEDLQAAALAKYLEETGSGLRQYHTNNLSTVTSESHHLTDPSDIQHGYNVAGHQTDPTSMPSEAVSDKEIASDQSDYGSSTDHVPGAGSRTDSDPIKDLQSTPPADRFGGIGSHLKYEREIEEFHHPMTDQEGEAIVNRVAHTSAGMYEALTNGPQQVKDPGLPYRISAQAEQRIDLIEEDRAGGIDERQEEPRLKEPSPLGVGPQQPRPNSIERASRMRQCCLVFFFFRR